LRTVCRLARETYHPSCRSYLEGRRSFHLGCRGAASAIIEGRNGADMCTGAREILLLFSLASHLVETLLFVLLSGYACKAWLFAGAHPAGSLALVLIEPSFWVVDGRHLLCGLCCLVGIWTVVVILRLTWRFIVAAVLLRSRSGSRLS
jgi:hypothetical protein